MDASKLRKQMPVSALIDRKIVLPAIGSAFVKLDPRSLIKNPVMFVLEVVTVLTTVIGIRDLFVGSQHPGFEFQIILWLWFTVLFANFATAIAEGRGNKEIAAILKVSIKTVEFHRGRIMGKLGVHTVAEVIRWAIRAGLVGE